MAHRLSLMNMRLLFCTLMMGACAVLTAQRGHHLGSVVLDFNTGIEAYSSTNVYTRTSADASRDTTIDSDAGNGHGSLGLEVGIGKFIGIGVRAKTNVFFRSLDAVMNARGDVYSNDLMLVVNLHPLPFKRFDLVLGAEAGMSKLRFDVNDLHQTMLTARGGYFAIYLSPRFYLKRFGFNIRAALPVFSYKELERSSASPEYLLSKWTASGLGVSLGVQYRFW